MASDTFSATAGSRHLGWLAVLGLLAVPLLIGGILTWALATPTAHLDRVTAAIVNDDEPVTVNGQTVPLGRQFAAGLIGGGGSPTEAAGDSDGDGDGDASSDGAGSPSTVSDDTASADAEATNFTWVLTNGDEAASGLQSGRYAAVVTIPPSFSAAATSIGGPATAARQAVIEVTTTPASAFLDPALTDVITAVATASLNQQLISQYLGNVYAGFNTINEPIGQASDGAASLASGAASVSSGADQLASGAEQLAGGLGSLDSGADALASGLGQLDEAAQALPGAAATLAQGSAEVAAGVDTLTSGVDGATQQFAGVVAEICQTTGLVCDRATAALTRLQDVDAQFGALASGADAVAAGNAQLAAALPELASGIDDSAVGATEVASGADQANTGAGSLSSGAQSLADGAAQVDDGAAQLAAGLSQAVEQIPTYTDEDITMLSSVVSQPVLADQSAITPGFQSVPLFAVIALWFGGIVIALARPAVPRRLLLTAASSRSIALRSAGVSAALGAGQGLVVAVTLLFGVSIGPAQWLGFAGASVFVGAVFALVNQGLAAALGAVGRLLALLVGLVALAAGISSTVPPAIDAIAAAMPTTPAGELLLATLTGAGGTVVPAVGALLLAAVLGFLLVFAGVASRRRVRPGAIGDTADAV